MVKRPLLGFFLFFEIAALSCANRVVKEKDVSAINSVERATHSAAQDEAKGSTVDIHPSELDQSSIQSLEDDHFGPLHVAAYRGDLVAVQSVLSTGADVNESIVTTQWHYTLTPLQAALLGARDDARRRGTPHSESAEQWSTARAAEQEQQTRGRSDAIRGPMQFEEVQRALLAAGAKPSLSKDPDLLPLNLAARTGQAILIKQLVTSGADVNQIYRSRSGLVQNPLIDAMSSGNLEAVKTLINLGADAKSVPAGSEVRFFGLASSDVRILRILLDVGYIPPKNASSLATKLGHVESAKELLRAVKPSSGSDSIDELLYITVVKATSVSVRESNQRGEYIATIKELLTKGASASAPRNSGEGIVVAIAASDFELARLLQDKGGQVVWTSVKELDHSPDILSYNLAFSNRLDALRKLRATGMPLDMLGAAILGDLEILKKRLNEHGSDEDRVSTALYFSSRYNQASSVSMLLEAGADPNCRLPGWEKANSGPVPLAAAVQAQNEEIVRLLVEAGANSKLLTMAEVDREKLPTEIQNLLKKPR